MNTENIHRWLDHISGDLSILQEQISEGEHQEQDFKFRIDSAQKIAITLVAFANTDGGKILIGVKDNGKITGIDPEEEYYMIDGAAQLYCDPPVPFETKVYEDEEQRRVLEIYVPPSPDRPHFVKTPDKKKIAYLRQKDENFSVNRVIIQYLRSKDKIPGKKNIMAYGPEERLLFDYLSEHTEISLSKYSRIAGISIEEAEKILVLFLRWGVIGYRLSDKGVRFGL